jgi:hypothetical protein
MGIFDRFRSRAQPPTPEQLRQQLFDAVAEHNDARLAKLCAEHEDAVLAAFPAWQRVPPEFRTPDKLRRTARPPTLTAAASRSPTSPTSGPACWSASPPRWPP